MALPFHKPSNNNADFYVTEIKRLRELLDKEKNKKHPSKNNIGFWGGCIVQTQAMSQSLLSWKDHKKVMDA